MEFARTKKQLYVRAFLNEKEVENLDLGARLADDYSLTHKASFVNKPFPRKPFNPQLNFTPHSRQFSPQSKSYSLQSGPKSNPSNPSDNSSHSFTSKPRFSVENKCQSPLSKPICNYCKQSGHIISECIALKRKSEKERQESPKPTGLTSLRLKPQSSFQDENPILAKTSETDAAITLRDVSYNARWFWTTIRYGPMTTAYLCWTTGYGFKMTDLGFWTTVERGNTHRRRRK